MSRIVEWVYRLRHAVVGVLVALTAALWIANPPIEFEQSIEGFFPPEHAALQDYRGAVRLFGEDHFVFVAYSDDQLWTTAGMERVARLVNQIQNEVHCVARIDSLDRMPVPWKVDAAVETLVLRPFAVGGVLQGLTTVRQAVKELSDRPQELAELRLRLCAHPLFNNLLINRSGTMTAVVVHLPTDPAAHAQVVERLRSAADAFGQEQELTRVAVVGPPVLVVDGFTSLERDNRTLAWVAMALMAGTMFVAIRSPFWAIVPLWAGWLTWLVTAAFLSWFGLRLTLSSGPIIAQTVVLCMPAASHLAVRFGQLRRTGAAAREAALQTLDQTSVPVVWCSVTAASGYLATYLASSVLPVRHMGLTMFVCTLLAGLLTYGLAAGVMGWHELLPRRLAPPAAATPVGRGVGALTGWVIARPLPALALFAIPCLVLAIPITRLRLESNYIKVYRADSRVARDYRYVEDAMGGIGLIELVFSTPAKINAAWLEQLRGIADELAQLDPELIQGVISPADLLLPTKTASADSPRKEAAAPERSLERRLQLLSLPTNVHLLDTLWNRSQEQMRLLVRIRESAETEDKERCFAELRAHAGARLGADTSLTGLSYLMMQIAQAVIVTASWSMFWSSLLILAMLMLALRSVRLGILALVPTLLAVGLVLGVMGWFDLRIDMATALVASVAIGLSVDDSFHCLLRWQRELKQGYTRGEALRLAYAGAGPGVIVSSAAVSIGFVSLVFSEFLPTANFGWLVAVATVGGSIGNLVLIPAFLALRQRPTPDRHATSWAPPAS